MIEEKRSWEEGFRNHLDACALMATRLTRGIDNHPTHNIVCHREWNELDRNRVSPSSSSILPSHFVFFSIPIPVASFFSMDGFMSFVKNTVTAVGEEIKQQAAIMAEES